MPFGFHANSNQNVDSSQSMEPTWGYMLQKYVNIQNKKIIDIVCGNGTYAKELAVSGARHVTAMDFSLEMLQEAADNCRGIRNMEFTLGSALNTGIYETDFDIVLERAFLHHLHELGICFREANRIMQSKGTFIIQDRTPDDCALPGSSSHIRGYFYERYPKLYDTELKRRYTSEQVIKNLHDNGFRTLQEFNFWEVRKVYDDFAQLAENLRRRIERTILFDLTDEQVEDLILYIGSKIDKPGPITEQDRWTIWIAEKI